MVIRFKYKVYTRRLFVWSGVVKLTKNADYNKCRYSGHGIGFDARSQFSLPSGEWSKNVVIFGVYNSLSL